MRATLAVIVDWSIYNVYNCILAFISTTTTKKRCHFRAREKKRKEKHRYTLKTTET